MHVNSVKLAKILFITSLLYVHTWLFFFSESYDNEICDIFCMFTRHKLE